MKRWPSTSLQQAAVAAAAFGDQDAGREDAGGVELHRFHVAQHGTPVSSAMRHAHAFADDGVGGDRYSARRRRWR
jgi:hypothetical protein